MGDTLETTTKSNTPSKEVKFTNDPANDDDKSVDKLVRSSSVPLREGVGEISNVVGVDPSGQDKDVNAESTQALRLGSDQNSSVGRGRPGSDQDHSVHDLLVGQYRLGSDKDHSVHSVGLPRGLSQVCPTCGKTPIGGDVELFNNKAVIKIIIPQKLIQGNDTSKTYVEPVRFSIFGDSESGSSARLPRSDSSSGSEVIRLDAMDEQAPLIADMMSLEEYAIYLPIEWLDGLPGPNDIRHDDLDEYIDDHGFTHDAGFDEDIDDHGFTHDVGFVLTFSTSVTNTLTTIRCQTYSRTDLRLWICALFQLRWN